MEIKTDMELANLIANKIKEDVKVFEHQGLSILHNMDLDPCLSILVDTEDGERVGFTITIKQHGKEKEL